MPKTRTLFSTTAGKPQPYGVSQQTEGINFALHSGQSTKATLCLFSYPKLELIAEVSLDPSSNRTGDVWHICLSDLPSETAYGWRLEASKKAYRHYCKSSNLLIDPYAKGTTTPIEWGNTKVPYQPLGLVMADHSFDWGEDKPLNTPLEELIIYEMHVRGFTQDSSSGVANSGTFLGVIEKIPHLLELGVNAVKLMPLHEFNENEYGRFNPFNGDRLYNYWGYSTVNFFSPMNRYASQERFAQSLTDFKTLVKELHKHQIEVILDVVFNHTAEQNDLGPVYSFKGIDCEMYYLVDSHQHLLNYTGCGNTVNCNHPIVREWIRYCLKYWVSEMHVDGFRFDLGAILTRGTQGEPMNNPPLIEEISNDPVLAKTKLIAEPWDCAGLYQLGNFYPNTFRWLEWNDRYRDSVRRFVKGDRGEKKEFAGRISGSQDLFWSKGSPLASINFVTAHDGFTLNDLVSYNQKNNSANGENDRDGHPNNVSWNCGAEGETDAANICRLREKQRRNFHLTLMLSQGVPMLLMGDEYGHSRFGNNNSWCQDNPLNWFLWNKLEENKDFIRFYKMMIHFRRRHPVVRRSTFLDEGSIDWHGTIPFTPDWEGDTQFLAFTLKDASMQLYAAFNAHHTNQKIGIPPSLGKNWKWVANTANLPPEDFFEEETAPLLVVQEWEMEAHSSLLLLSQHA